MLFWVLLIGLATVRSATGQLDENCTVSVLNRTVQVRPDGVWIIPNIPANLGQVRARATCVKDGLTVSGQSDFFTVPANGALTLQQDINLETAEPIPASLTITAPTTTLTVAGAIIPLSVTAVFPDDSTRDVTAARNGTNYTSSNPTVATVSPDGVVTAVTSGTVLVSAMYEGTLGLLRIQVVLAGDADGDGIPDDVELANGLNPNNPVDALEDFDKDGLTNKQELIDLGTDFRVADTDGDGIADGEEIIPGTDGFVTDPILDDTDGDEIRDGLEVSTGSDPTDPASFNLAAALQSLVVAPADFVLNVNTLLGEASRQLIVTGTLIDTTNIDLTSTIKGTTYTSSDLTVCNFGATDGEVFAGQDGTCTVMASNSGFSATAIVMVQTFAPTALSFVAIPGEANNVDVSGDFAYVAAGSAGLQVVDVFDRDNPALVGNTDTPGSANDVKVVGKTAFVADGSAGLQIVDVTDPLDPVIIGTVDTPGDAQDVVIASTFAFVADGVGGLQVINISDPSTPSIIGGVDTPGTARGVDVDLRKGIAVIADGTAGIQVVTIADPTNPTVIGSTDTGDARDVVLDTDFAFVADFSSSFTSVDISDPSDPVIRNSTPRATGGLLFDVALAGQFAFGADIFFVNGVPIIDVNTPETPIPRAILDFSSFRDDNGTGIAVDSTFVYLTARIGNSRLYIGQYLTLEDTAGIPPSVSITSPASGDTVIEGATISVTVEATDDSAVVAVNLIVDGEVVSTDSRAPYQFDIIFPANATSLTLGATAIDPGDNTGVAQDVVLNAAGIPPSVSITSLASGDTVIEGAAISVTVEATDDSAVVAVNFLVNGEVVSTDTAPPYQFNLTVPTGANSLTLGATAIDLGDNTGRAQNVVVNVIPDPLTTVVGRVIDNEGNPIAGVMVATINEVFSTTGADGTFAIPNVSTVMGDITVLATATIGSQPVQGRSFPTTPVRGGTTDVIEITVFLAFQSIAAGDHHTCAVVGDGTVKCWGANFTGELGAGTITGLDTCFTPQFGSCSQTPVTVVGVSTAVAVSAGTNHTCARLADGTVQCWGSNTSGQLGIGTTTGPESCGFRSPCSTVPVTVTGISTAVAVSAGTNYTCALLADGTVQCWGSNAGGQLGIGTNSGPENCPSSCSTTPAAVSGLTTLAAVIVAGDTHACAGLADGTVQCWGGNSGGQLGNGMTSPFSATPVAVIGDSPATRLSNVIALGAGRGHTCAVLADGTAQCWGGDNRLGQLGNVAAPGVRPIEVTGLTDAKALEGANFHTCALLADGAMQCWGNNSVGQLGTEADTEFDTCLSFSAQRIPCSRTPVNVSGISLASALAAGGNHTCAIDGTVKCWGINSSGQLGNGATTSASLPTPIAFVDADRDVLSDIEEATYRTDPLNPDTDGDGLSDGQEIAHRADPLSPDPDGDGLNDSEEVALGTNPLNADTDGDGLSDGQEVAAGEDPLVPEAISPTVAIINPPDGATFVEGETLTVLVEATDNVAVAQVDVSVNGFLFTTDTTAPYELVFTVPAGVSSLTFNASAQDIAGHTATTDVTVSVDPDVLTTVQGRVIDPDDAPTPDAEVIIGFTGLKAEFFDFDTPLNTLPELNGLTPDVTMMVSAVNIRNPDGLFGTDPFAVGLTAAHAGRFSGLIRITTAGLYTFILGANEGARLTVNGTTVVDMPAGSGVFQESTGTITLSPGLMPIDVVYYASLGDSELQLSFIPPGGERQVVPPSALVPDPQLFMTTTEALGAFSIPDVPTNVGDIVVRASATVNGLLLNGTSLSVAPVNGGTTDVGDITVRPPLLLSAGRNHTCTVLANGTVQCWGNNGLGQLGDGSSLNTSTPVVVTGFSDAVAIASGGRHTCALLLDGAVQCWGGNDRGQLGIGTFTNSLLPVTVTGISTAIVIATGGNNTCAVLADGTARCWGSRAGDGSTLNTSTPVVVTGLSDVAAIAGGTNHTCALLENGTVQCWGDNSDGQLGDGTTTSTSTPVVVTGLSTAVAVAAGGAHTCALLANGTVQCWGNNLAGQLGDGTETFTLTPVVVTGLSTAVDVAAGDGHTCALLANGTVQCWGDNRQGQLGIGTRIGPENCFSSSSFFCSTNPVMVTGLSTAIAISVGGDHTCAVLADGAVQCWGNNRFGQLGTGMDTGPETCGNFSCSTTPVTVNGL